MGKFNVSVWLILVVTVVLTGCTSVKTVDLNKRGKGPSLVTDATERIVTNIDIVNRSIPGQVLPKRIVCAEPSPDIAVAFSKAISAGIKAGENSAAFSFSTSRSIAQLGERLATVQLLRDMAYRNCEAYANGAISATSYTILNSRLHKTIATLLSGEMMAGAFGRNLAVLTPSSESESAVDGDSSNNGDVRAGSSSNGRDNSREYDYAIGQILSRQQTPTEVADQLKQIHQNFIEDIGFVTLIDACIAHMSAPQKNKIEKYGDIVELIKGAREKGVDSSLLDEMEKNLIENDSSFAEKIIQIAQSGDISADDKTRKIKRLILSSDERGFGFVFMRVCEDSVLKGVKDLVKELSLRKVEIRRLQVVNAIVNACNKDDKTRDSSVCKTLDISR